MANEMHFVLHVSQAEKYPAKQHARRVAAALGSGDGLIYLLGQYAYNKEDSDMPKTWYQRRFFYYLSGVDEPNACLTYNCKTDELVLYLEEINWDQLLWTGRGSTINEAKEKYDVDDVRWNPQLFPDLRHWLKDKPKKALFFALHEDHVPVGIDDLPVEHNKLFHVMEQCRAIKDQHEIKLIEQANRISAFAHNAVLAKAPSASNESQLSAVFQEECISRLASQAYPPIVASGTNASTLHYSANNEPLAGRQLICIDAGAAFQLYASDVTRTFPIDGKWSKEARAIYDLVLEIQLAAIKASGPGVHMIDIHNQVARSSIVGLLKLGILHNGTVEDIEAAGTIRGFYPHGLGHHLGLETHDVTSVPLLRYPKGSFIKESWAVPPVPLSAQRSESQAMEAGNVVTIEPGLYFNRQYLSRYFLSTSKHARFINIKTLDQYWDVGGVRIEDNILITEDGNRNLTTVTKDPEELSRIISSAVPANWN